MGVDSLEKGLKVEVLDEVFDGLLSPTDVEENIEDVEENFRGGNFEEVFQFVVELVEELLLEVLLVHKIGQDPTEFLEVLGVTLLVLEGLLEKVDEVQAVVVVVESELGVDGHFAQFF